MPVDFASLVNAVYLRTHERLEHMLGWLFNGTNRYFWVYWLGLVLIGGIAYFRHYRGQAGVTGNLLKFLFPRAIYAHPSAILDYKLLVANQLLGPASALVGLVLGGMSVTYMALLIQQGLDDTFGARIHTGPVSIAFGATIALLLTLAIDFSTYVTHRLSHKWPLLWEFHKVHHSAEVLTPFTLLRKHPVYDLFDRICDLIIVGPIEGLALYLLGYSPDPLLLFGGNIVYSVFHLMGSHLRHSHVWLSFGPVLNRIVVSPALHQIHHSKARRHWDKNFGEVFALWDWIFGTLYMPGAKPEELEFGIAGATKQEHPTLMAAYLVPFRNARLILGRRFDRRSAPRRRGD